MCRVYHISIFSKHQYLVSGINVGDRFVQRGSADHLFHVQDCNNSLILSACLCRKIDLIKAGLRLFCVVSDR